MVPLVGAGWQRLNCDRAHNKSQTLSLSALDARSSRGSQCTNGGAPAVMANLPLGIRMHQMNDTTNGGYRVPLLQNIICQTFHRHRFEPNRR